MGGDGVCVNRFCVAHECLHAEPCLLPGAVARQVTRVLRLAPGDRVVLFSGDGEEHEARIVAAAERRVEVQLTATRLPDVELRCPIEFGLALLKGEKLEWTVQKLTELGVSRIGFIAVDPTPALGAGQATKGDSGHTLRRATIET